VLGKKKYTITAFFTNLSYKTWDITFNMNDVNIMFSSYSNTYLRFILF